jgi:hypothetical protein
MARNSDEIVDREIDVALRTNERGANSGVVPTVIKGIWSSDSGSTPANDGSRQTLTRRRRKQISEERPIARTAGESDGLWNDVTSTYSQCSKDFEGYDWTLADEHTTYFRPKTSEVDRSAAHPRAEITVQPATSLLAAEIAAKLASLRKESTTYTVPWFWVPATALIAVAVALVAHASATAPGLFAEQASEPRMAVVTTVEPVQEPTQAGVVGADELGAAPQPMAAADDTSGQAEVDRQQSPERTGAPENLPAPSDAVASSSSGTLTIDSYPPSRVFIDNTLIGETPVQALQVVPGNHRVRLVNEELNMSRSFHVTVQPGQTVSRVEMLRDHHRDP